MKKENVVELGSYRRREESFISHSESACISKELEQAIQHLIHRLRELGPM